VLQTNIVRQEELIDARAHPERHPDLVVRVSGYSAYFVSLNPEIQDDIIGRTQASV
jgi:pyruvate-formate lyase